MKKRNNMSPERNASPPKIKRYITQFQDSWVKEWPGKIARSHKDYAYALSRVCRSDFGIGSASGKIFILFCHFVVLTYVLKLVTDATMIFVP